MAQGTDQLAAFNKAQMEAALKLAETAAEHMEKLAEMQFNAAKSTYANSVNALRQLLNVKDVNDLGKVTAGLAQPALDEATSYMKNLYKLLASANAQFATSLEQQVGELNKNMTTALDTAVKSAPPGSEAAFAAARSAIQSTSSVYESMVKAAKQMSALAEANIAAVSQGASGKKD
jgi:phasin family protein